MKSFNRFCVCAALLCAVLCGCQSDPGEPRPSEIVTVPVTTKPKLSSEVKDCVTVGREQTFTYTDKNKNSVSLTYRIPALCFDTEEAIAVNNEINDLYLPQFVAAQEATSAGKEPAITAIDFNAYVNDDVVTLVISEESPAHALSFHVCNYNKANGKRLDNKGLLAYLQRDSDQAMNDLKAAVEADYHSKFKEENFPDDYYYQLDLTVSDDTLSQAQFFLNSDAKLYAVCTEYASVGEGVFQVLIAF